MERTEKLSVDSLTGGWTQIRGFMALPLSCPEYAFNL